MEDLHGAHDVLVLGRREQSPRVPTSLLTLSPSLLSVPTPCSCTPHFPSQSCCLLCLSSRPTPIPSCVLPSPDVPSTSFWDRTRRRRRMVSPRAPHLLARGQELLEGHHAVPVPVHLLQGSGRGSAGPAERPREVTEGTVSPGRRAPRAGPARWPPGRARCSGPSWHRWIS